MTIEASASGPTTSQQELLAVPVWLIQYSPRGAQALLRSWASGEDFEYPKTDRNVHSIREGDIVLFWVSGAGAKAGVFGFGLATGNVEKLDHAKNYKDPDGPRTQCDSAEVSLAAVFEAPVCTREELREIPAFADYDLFRMPNRPNAFAVTPEQWQVIHGRLEEVMGR